MNFIERWLSVSPDGGDGSSELLIFLAVVIVVTGLYGRRLARTNARSAG